MAKRAVRGAAYLAVIRSEWFSGIGIALCVVYLVLSAASYQYALLIADPKGSFVFKQLPIAPALALVSALGAERQLWAVIGNSWLGAFALLLTPTLALVYAVGWMVGRACSGFRSLLTSK